MWPLDSVPVECHYYNMHSMSFWLWVTLYNNVHMHHFNSQLTFWVGGNGPVHAEKKINKWNVQHYYIISLQKWKSTLWQYQPKHFCVKFCTCNCLSHTSCILSCSLFCCVNLRGQIKEAACTLRKQGPTLPGNRALSRCECFKQV